MTIEIQEGETYVYRTVDQAKKEDSVKSMTKIDMLNEYMDEIICLKHFNSYSNKDVQRHLIEKYDFDINAATLSIQLRNVPAAVTKGIIARNLIKNTANKNGHVVQEISEMFLQLSESRKLIEPGNIMMLKKAAETLVLLNNEADRIKENVKSDAIESIELNTNEAMLEKIEDVQRRMRESMEQRGNSSKANSD